MSKRTIMKVAPTPCPSDFLGMACMVEEVVEMTPRQRWNESQQQIERVRKPKKLTMDQLRKKYEGKGCYEIENEAYWEYQMGHAIFSEKHKPSDLERLVELCSRIAHLDKNFQNLSSEIPYAKKHALEVLEMAKEIKVIVDNTKQQDARLTRNILNVMNIMYMRVFGDQMSYLEFEGTNLEDWIKSASSNARLRDLMYLEDTIENIFKHQ